MINLYKLNIKHLSKNITHNITDINHFILRTEEQFVIAVGFR